MKSYYYERCDSIKGLNDVMNYQFSTYNIIPEFPEDVESLRKEDLMILRSRARRDFRGESVFTIDSEDCKDMDDAVCVKRTNIGYCLSVHIADVGVYVQPGSRLDEIACYRATSIYLPNLTIPMLPAVLSNNVCSLNPNVDRLTLSVIMNIDHSGKLINYRLTKGIINSKVKGVYSEINRLLAGEADEKLKAKYSIIRNELGIMVELYEKLRKVRMINGATIKDSNKPKIKFGNRHIDIIPHSEGVAENIIEEFMVMANRAIAEYLYEHDLPAIYRIQERKNNMAAYQPVIERHAELALECYSHFTSPIRRVADLKIHQILTMHLNGADNEELHEVFDETLFDVCDRATKRSRTAKQVQDKCEQYCYAEFFKSHLYDRFTGVVIGYDKKNRPIVKIDKYNIRLIGYALINNGKIGDQYSFQVSVSTKNSEMVANNAMKIA